MAPCTQKIWIDSLHIDMLLSAVSLLVVTQPSSEIPDGLMNIICGFLFRRVLAWLKQNYKKKTKMLHSTNEAY
jgi:hypothetical protein